MSLLRPLAGAGEPRFAMLETIRQFGLEQLAETGETDGARRRHARYYVRLAEEIALHLSGVRGRPWLARLAAEQDNLRVALDWCASVGDAGDAEGRLWGSAWWPPCGNSGRSGPWPPRAAPAWSAPWPWPPATPRKAPRRPSIARPWPRPCTGPGPWPACRATTTPPARSWSAAPPCGGTWGRSGTWPAPSPPWAWPAWWTASRRGPRPALEESVAIFRRLGDGWGLAVALIGHAEVLTRRHGPPAAVAPLEEALALFRAQGEPWGQARALGGLGKVALGAGQLPLARERFEAALALSTPDDQDLLFADLAIILGEVLRFEGDYRHAEALYERSLELWRPVGHRRHVAIILHNLGYVALQGGHLRRAPASSPRPCACTPRPAGAPSPTSPAASPSASPVSPPWPPGPARLPARPASSAPPPPSVCSMECQWDDADRRERERYTAIARDALGPPAFAAARAQGEGLTLEEAVAEALDVAALPDLDPRPSRTPAPRTGPGARAVPLTPDRRPDAPRAAGGRPRRRGPDQPPGRRPPRDQREHRGEPRRPHPEQARLPQPVPDRGMGRDRGLRPPSPG